MDVLKISNLSKSFGPDARAAHHFSLEAKPGELLALVGESGCGKTTVLRMIAGFEVPDSGTIHLERRIVAGPQTHIPPEKRGVGLLFQDYALFPHLTVAQNVAFGLRTRSERPRKDRVQEMLVLCGIEDYADRYPHQISGGQQQRTALARALAPAPGMILLDEPFSNIDTLVKAQVRKDLKHLFVQAGVTAILVTHDISDAFAIADRVAVMRKGELLQIDTPEGIYQRPVNDYVAGFFGRYNFVRADATATGFDTPYGSVSGRHSFGQGEPVFLLYRPEELTIEASDSANTKVDSVTFQGHSTEVKVSTGLHHVWVNDSEGRNWKPGQPVRIGLLPKTPYVVPGA